MFEDYPYERNSDSSIVSYKETSSKKDLMHVYESDDDKVCVKKVGEHKFIIRYDAPREMDKGRGHLSIWINTISDQYDKCYLYTGDDGTIYDKYMRLFNNQSSVYSFVEENEVNDILERYN